VDSRELIEVSNMVVAGGWGLSSKGLASRAEATTDVSLSKTIPWEPEVERRVQRHGGGATRPPCQDHPCAFGRRAQTSMNTTSREIAGRAIFRVRS